MELKGTSDKHQSSQVWILIRLAAVNRLGMESEWEFIEWRHGRTGRPMGYPHQAWSAGMYIFAYQFLANAEVPLLFVQ